MDENRGHLYDRLATRLGLSSAEMKPIRRELDKWGVVDDFLEGRYQFDDLVDDARETPEYKNIAGKRRARAGRPPLELTEYFEVPLAPYEEERADVLSEALALLAGKHPKVMAFRKEVLGGALLTPERARDFVTSPAVRSFWRTWFKRWAIPPVEHKAKVVRTDRDVEGFRWGEGESFDILEDNFEPWRDRFVEVYVEPPGITKSVLYGSYDIPIPEGLRVDHHYFFERPESVVRYPWEDRIHEVRALLGSLLDELLRLSNALAGVYGWKQEDALWFVLTGETPQVSPLELGASLLTGHDRSRPVWSITLEVAPWVNADTVKDVYQRIQRQIKGGDVSRGEIKQPRKLAVFRFVTEQERAHGKRPAWSVLFERWNEKYSEDPEWRYEDAGSLLSPKKPWNSFQRDFREVERAVMRPRHHFPKRKVTTRLEEWQEEDLSRRRTAAERDLNMTLDYLEGRVSPDDY